MEMNAIEFVTKEFIWMVPCLMILAEIIKQIPNIPNWVIPFILLVVGILLGCVSCGFSTQSLVQGFICGLCATGTHQLIKQPLEKK